MLGVNFKNNATKSEYGDDHPLEQLKVTFTQIDHKSPSRWNRKIRTTAAPAAEAQMEPEPPGDPEQPAERNLICLACKRLIDVKHKRSKMDTATSNARSTG